MSLATTPSSSSSLMTENEPAQTTTTTSTEMCARGHRTVTTLAARHREMVNARGAHDASSSASITRRG